MMRKGKMTRREFFRLTAVGAAGAALTACAAPTAVPTEEPAAAPTEAPPAAPEPTATKPAVNIAATATTGPTATPVAKYNEAPMLADLVQAGSLPPVEERLPINPGVLNPVEMVGNYGGGIRRAFNGVSDRWGPTKLQDRGMAWFDKDLALHPRLAESWEVNDDATEWTFYMRPGAKWSDGTPCTTADVKWWYENNIMNTTLNPAVPAQWRTGPNPGVAMQLEVIDDFTFKLTFAHPNPMFIYKLTRSIPITPGFYMEQYHMDLVEDKAALEAEIAEKGFDSWDRYFLDNRDRFDLNPDKPSLGPFLMRGSTSSELFMMERNPYYFATDPEGNQLPYLDNVQHRLFENAETLNLWIVGGEIDFQSRHVSFGNYTLFKESEADGDYKVVLGISASHLAIQPNHTTKEPKLREFFQNRNVRIAMNLAMNRDDMNELVWDGMLKPRQYSPLPLSPQYYEPAESAYVEYNPDRANELLDAEGYDQRDAEGFRMWKDGSGPITFNIEGTAQTGTPDEDTVLIAIENLADIGIKAAYKSVERSLYTEHYQANDIEAAFWGGDRTVLPLVPEAIIFRGTQIDRPWACAYGLYWNNNEDPNGEEPPADSFVKKIWDIWAEVAVEPDPDQQTAKFQEILQIWAEETPMIGLLGEMPSPCIVKNGIRNFVPGFPNDDTTGDENVYQTETYFWENPEEHTL
jgi:peptide/nickel transport system substrate-binding protein